ncbi:flavodoxin family protein [Sporosalibacterium faouarense]|uniref:flavodoxin family protein n=1 Tax=Sporosalibacterium faouarense TaxID=516123 RepID=UPI00141C86F9|nr:NAD(P)H-dependent oxidoreductase [Sporosalibacterium faouarense]MTI49763.1 flavodoxin family protein [Bacillota bacterium]
MKVFTYVGSKRGFESKTLKSVNQLLRNLSENNNDIPLDTVLYSADNIDMRKCTGCCNCFFNGFCPLDEKDDMKKIKNDMLSSDLIIIASPVYLHHVSGNTKTLIDRLSHWAHIFKLIGKLGVTVSVSSTNGNEHVDFYLQKVLSMFGIIVIDSLSLPLDLLNQQEIDKKIKDSSDKISQSISNRTLIRPTQKQEFLFRSLKDMYSSPTLDNAESNYWASKDYFESESFAELFQKHFLIHD